jgi:hypothetical protein
VTGLCINGVAMLGYSTMNKYATELRVLRFNKALKCDCDGLESNPILYTVIVCNCETLNPYMLHSQC